MLSYVLSKGSAIKSRPTNCWPKTIGAATSRAAKQKAAPFIVGTAE